MPNSWIKRYYFKLFVIIFSSKLSFMSEKIILTGDRPTGRLHIGHYVGSLRRRVELQNQGDYKEMYVFIADAQALTDNIDNPEKVRQNVIEVALDYLSCGLDPEKVTIFIQSQIPELCELSFYFMDLVSVQRLQRNPTVKTEMAMRGFNGNAGDDAAAGDDATADTGDAKSGGIENKKGLPVGFFTYPISQAADITLFKATTVPAGEDQKPMLEQATEIVRRFNNIYGETLVEPHIMLPENDVCRRLPGTDGKAKMSKSLGNCIYLSDTAKELKKKVNSMFTDPLHLTIEQPGHLEGTYVDSDGNEVHYQNTVFVYLDAFCEDSDFERFLPEYKNLDELKAHYQKGGLGDGTCKKFLLNILNDRLGPIRERRAELEKDIPAIYEILRKGCEKARAKAIETMDEVRSAMKINYFDDAELIGEQSRRFAS